MATITSTAAGGLFSAGASWIGGVAPGPTDSVVIDSASGGITHDAHYTTTGTITHTRGLYASVNGGTSYNVTCNAFSSSNSNTRTLTLGSSTITCTGGGGTAWDTSTTTGLTITANTATIVLSGSSATFLPGAGTNFNGASVSFTGFGALFGSQGLAAPTLGNMTRVGTAAADSFRVTQSVTLTGTFTASSANGTTQRVLIWTNALGTARSITAAAVSLTNVDFMDITGAGAASWTGTSLGDCGGNAGITFSPATTRYAVAAGNWSSTAVWSTSSGGSSGASVPLPQDNVVLNASSGVGTITVDMPRVCKDLTCTGYTGTLKACDVSGVYCGYYGSITFASTMTLTQSSGGYLLAGRGAHTFTSAGKSLGTNSVQMSAVGGSYTLNDALACGFLFGSSGTFYSNGFSITSPGVTGLNNPNLGSSTVTLTGTGTVWTGLGTVNAGTSTIVLTDTSSATKTVAGGGKTYGALVVQGGASNSVVITGANTFASISAPAGTVLTLPASTVTTVGDVQAQGSPRNYLRLPGVASNYVSVPGSAALDITGDLEIVTRVAPVSWIPSTYQVFVGKSYTAYEFRQDPGSGRLKFGVPPTANVFTSSVDVPFGAGAAGWVKVTLDVDNGAGGSTARFYTAPDQASEPTTWTQLGSDQVIAAVLTVPTNANAVAIGARPDGTLPVGGPIYRAIVRSGIGGTTVLDVDFSGKPFGADTFTATTGQTVTINGDLAKAGDGRVLLNSSTPGTAATISKASGTVNCDYLVVKDSTATGGATFNAGVRSFLTNSTGWNATGDVSRTARALGGAFASELAAKTTPNETRALGGAFASDIPSKAVAIASTALAGAAPRTNAPAGARTSNTRAIVGGLANAAPTKTIAITGRAISGVVIAATSRGPVNGCIILDIEKACPGPRHTVGGVISITATCNRGANPYDPETIELRVQRPDGTVIIVAMHEASRSGTGIYTWTLPIDAAGRWRVEAITVGRLTASTDARFYVGAGVP